MRDAQVGAALRLVRRRRGWTQEDLAGAAGVCQATVSRIERGHLRTLAVQRIREVLAALDMQLDLAPRWRGADLDRALNAGHNAMHEALARQFSGLPEWATRPEVSFSHWGERGVIDMLAWHDPTRTLLVVELKTDLVDPGGLIAQVDRYQRLAPVVARQLGWEAVAASSWVVVADDESNRHRLSDHLALLRGRFPLDGRSIESGLGRPTVPIEALSFVRIEGHARVPRRGGRRTSVSRPARPPPSQPSRAAACEQPAPARAPSAGHSRRVGAAAATSGTAVRDRRVQSAAECGDPA